MAAADFLQRSEILLGREALEKLEASSVCICGLGGVGSFAAEAIARAGVGKIRLVDFDNIALSNINRQLPALHSTVGTSKAETVKARIEDINPSCKVEIFTEKITPENAAFAIGETDYCIDAVDDVKAKIAIIKFCTENRIGIVSAMGTGNKICPELLRISELQKTYNCPLAKAMRQALKKEGITEPIDVVFSIELPVKNSVGTEEKTIGSCSFVPSVAGLMQASVAIRSLLGLKINKEK